MAIRVGREGDIGQMVQGRGIIAQCGSELDWSVRR